jgi:uncharacterized protein GlcG (DUF336 family)
MFHSRKIRSLDRACALGILLVILNIACAVVAADGASQIRDIAGMFALDSLRKGRSALERIETEYHVPILIETIDSLNGEPIEDAAARRYREAGSQSIYILLAKENRRMSDVLVPSRLTSRLSEERRETIRDAFLTEFRRTDFDAGLEHGIATIEKMLAETRDRDTAPVPVSANTTTTVDTGAPESSLIVRNQVRLTLAGARRIIAAAEVKAAEMKLKVNIAVVDDGGHLLAFERMDGARPASGYTAITKATTAATFRAPTGPVPAGTSTPDPLLNLSLQNAASASGGKLTTLYGGVPIIVDSQVIGGVGVGGGTGEQDAEMARAGISKLLEGLKGKNDR